MWLISDNREFVFLSFFFFLFKPDCSIALEIRNSVSPVRGSLPAEKSPTSALWKSSTEETPRSRAINHISKIIPAALRSGRLDRAPSARRNSRVIGSQLYAQGVWPSRVLSLQRISLVCWSLSFFFSLFLRFFFFFSFNIFQLTLVRDQLERGEGEGGKRKQWKVHPYRVVGGLKSAALRNDLCTILDHWVIWNRSQFQPYVVHKLLAKLEIFNSSVAINVVSWMRIFMKNYTKDSTKLQTIQIIWKIV